MKSRQMPEQDMEPGRDKAQKLEALTGPLQELGGWAAGKKTHALWEVDSTNLWAQRSSDEGADHGSLFIAEYQSAGRGSRGRSWEAGEGEAAMMSLLLKPHFAPQIASMLTLVMGLSVARAVRLRSLEAGIKWPNDVVVSRKKIAGILTEMRLAGDQIRDVVIGVGINVNTPHFPPELEDKATSLFLEAGILFDRGCLMADIMEEFETAYGKFEKTHDLSLLKEEYEAILVNREEEVKVLDPTAPYTGTARGIDRLGRLMVELPDGSLRSVNAGEVSVRGLYTYV